MTTNDEERVIESLKLEFEMHKHFTTVLAALGVVLLTILQGFFAVGRHEEYSWLQNFFLITCFSTLGVGGIFSIAAMHIVFQQVRDPDTTGDIKTRRRRYRRLRAGILGATLVGGIALFLLFVWEYMRSGPEHTALLGVLRSGNFRECDFL